MLPGTVVERIDKPVFLFFFYGGEVMFFRKVLADKTICVFADSSFPGMIWMGKVDLGIQRLTDRPMLGKLFAVVTGDRTGLSLKQTAQGPGVIATISLPLLLPASEMMPVIAASDPFGIDMAVDSLASDSEAGLQPQPVDEFFGAPVEPDERIDESPIGVGDSLEDAVLSTSEGHAVGLTNPVASKALVSFELSSYCDFVHAYLSSCLGLGKSGFHKYVNLVSLL
jgi:hypothetical protein